MGKKITIKPKNKCVVNDATLMQSFEMTARAPQNEPLLFQSSPGMLGFKGANKTSAYARRLQELRSPKP